ncbi:hypothetical protein ACH5RR_036286 [Cinchona calisaya]|uniref:Uncharacterized protein n=1 Tax=Cinchona calisaya TaxID=153742 RepID=A0ABD2Y2R8_9GENT
MAYAAVTCLIKTLEHLLRFPLLVIKIKDLQMNFPMSRGTDIPTDFLLEEFLRITPLMLSVSYKWSGIDDFMNPGKMKKLHNRIRRAFGCPVKWDSFCKPFIYGHGGVSICASRKAKYFFCEKAAKMVVLCDHLRLLRDSLGDSANMCNDREMLKYLEGLIIDVSYTSEDFIEELLFDSSIELEMMNFVNSVSNVDPRYLLGRVKFETDVRNIVDQRSGLYHSLQETLEKVDSIRRELRKIHAAKQTITGNLEFGDVSFKDSEPVTENLQLGDASVKESTRCTPSWKTEVIGLDDDLLSILDRLTMVPSGLERMAIVGMGGIGKTTLARRVFDEPLIGYHFYVRAWVTVSQGCRVRDLLLGLLDCPTQATDERYKKSNEQLAEDLYRSLKGKRYLIVMDDLWDTKAWDDVKRCFPDDKNGSRILVTTRLMKVADYVKPKVPPHCMNLLDVDHSWKLLHEKVFGKEDCPPELVDIGKRIARKCRGLPLAIVVLAGLLSRVRRTSDCWNGIADSVSSVVNTDPEQCMKILSLSYNHLPHYQRACFLYMGAFPEDCEIEAQKLINLWVAEGFLDTKKAIGIDEGKYLFLSSTGTSVEHLAEYYLEDLIARSLVLVGKRSFSGKIKTCRIHDLLRDLCLKEAQTKRFMHVLKRGTEGLPTDMNNQRRLCFHSDFSNDFLSVPKMPLVRSFLCFTLGSGFVPDIMFFHLGFKLLRVLDVISLHFEHFPVQIITLVHLRYLALTATFELPVSLSKLRNLRTLIIHGPWISTEYGEVPTLLLEYWNMPWLRHLRTSVACYLSNPFITKMDLRCPLSPKNLQSLSTITFTNCTKEVFAIMPCLKKLGICETEEDYSSDESSKCLSNLVYLQQLQALKCSFYEQTTKARISLHTFPSNLRKLTLSWSYMPWESMITIAKLPFLEVLKLKNYAFQGTEWEPSEEGFRYLKQLLIENTDLVHWKASSFHFPRLQHLILKSCKLLEEIPFGVGEIATLQLIELHSCSESAEISTTAIKEIIEGLDIHLRSNQ